MSIRLNAPRESDTATARDEVELDKLTARLVEVVQESMQPESVSLWLKKTPNGQQRTTGRL